MSIFENDRPEGYDEDKDAAPRIHPEPLGPPEKLAIDAEDIEEFAGHYGDEDGPEVTGAQGAP